MRIPALVGWWRVYGRRWWGCCLGRLLRCLPCSSLSVCPFMTMKSHAGMGGRISRLLARSRRLRGLVVMTGLMMLIMVLGRVVLMLDWVKRRLKIMGLCLCRVLMPNIRRVQ